MFAGVYFTKSYFTDDYFPDSNLGVVGDSVTVVHSIGRLINPGTLLGRC